MLCPRCHTDLVGELEMVRGPSGGACLVHARCTTAADRAQIGREAAETERQILTASTDPAVTGAASRPIRRAQGKLLRLRVVCSWCQKVKDEGDPGAGVSHGICPDCARQYFPDEADAALAEVGIGQERAGHDRPLREMQP